MPITVKDFLPALAHEAEAVNAIKRDKRFTVVIGNPPYSGESSNKIRWIEDAIRDTYQTIKNRRLVEKGKKNWLLDDYVKFILLCHLLTKRCGMGVIEHDTATAALTTCESTSSMN